MNAVGIESNPTDGNTNAGQQFVCTGHKAAGANCYISWQLMHPGGHHEADVIAHAAKIQTRGLTVAEMHNDVQRACCELDTHADNCCIGANFVIL